MTSYNFNSINNDSLGKKLCNNQIKEVKKWYLNRGYNMVTSQILIKDNWNVVVLKSKVKTTNNHETQSLSLSENVYEKIKNKPITIEVFERNCYRSVDIKRYTIFVLDLIDTHTYRCKRSKTKRYNLILLNNYINLKLYKKSLSA